MGIKQACICYMLIARRTTAKNKPSKLLKPPQIAWDAWTGTFNPDPKTLNLPQLQNLVKRDPAAYKDEFRMQLRRFESEFEIFKLRPTQDSERFTDLVTFISHVASYYKTETEQVPLQLLDLMDTNSNTLHPDVRAKLLQALILLRNRGLVDPLLLLKLAFRLLAVQDKTLRTTLADYIVNDIKTLNINKKNEKLNRRIQALLYDVIAEDTSIAALKAVEILSDLYRRRVWTDERTVNVIASACTSPTTRVSIAAIHFFLGIESKMAEDEVVEKKVGLKEINYHEHSKKTRKRKRQVERQVDRNEKQKREKEEKVAVPLFPAIQLLNNPQTLAEKMLAKLRQSGEKFEVKLLILNLVSRLVGCHKLLLLSFYSFVQRYLTSHQQSVTSILAYLIQACHDLVPPEDLLPVLKVIAHNFITERCSNEVITVGINSIREIFSRSPALLLEPDMEDFVQDLVMYGRKAHKSVMMAAHSLINLVRELCPSLLRRQDRGKFHDPTVAPSAYGHMEVQESVEGIELLEAFERGDISIDSDGEVVWGREDEEDEDEGEDGESEEEGGEWEEEEEEEQDDDDAEQDDADEDDADGGEEWEDVDEEEEEEGEEDEDEQEDGDDSDNWEDVEDDGEDEDEEEEEVPQLVPVPETLAVGVPPQQMQQRDRLDGRRLLTPEDFTLLAKLRASLQEKLVDPKFRSKKIFGDLSAKLRFTSTAAAATAEGEDGDEGEGEVKSSFAVEPDSLAPSVRAHKSSKIERISAILSGRTNEKFRHEGHAGGLTHKEKKRTKNYVMVRKGKNSVAKKLRESNSESRYKKMHSREQFGREKRKRRRI